MYFLVSGYRKLISNTDIRDKMTVIKAAFDVPKMFFLSAILWTIYVNWFTIDKTRRKNKFFATIIYI